MSDAWQSVGEADALASSGRQPDGHDVPDVREDIIESIMCRVGAALTPARFAYEVATAYASVAPTRGTARLESRHADAAFDQMILGCGPVGSVLVLGCGDGLCGFDTSYARRAFLEIWPATPRVTECAVTQPMLWNEEAWPDRQFDVVICYSMIHYIYDLRPFFKMVRQSVRPGGAFVTAGHNARFWQKAELRQAADIARQTVRKRARWRSYFSGRAWYQRVRRRLDPVPRPDMRTRVNEILVPRLRLTGELAAAEIVHMVDLHRPSHDPSPFHIGLPGLDVNHLSRTHLEGFSLTAYRSHGWSGYVAPERLPVRLRARDAELGQQYPDDGVFFCASWQRSL